MDIGQGIASAFKAMFIMCAAGGVVIGGAGALIATTVLSSDIEFDLNDSTKAAAKENIVSVDTLCTEMLKAQAAITDQIGTGSTPVVIMDMASCRTLYQGTLASPLTNRP